MAIKAPKGTHDLLPDEAQFWDTFQKIAQDVCQKYGYSRIYTPIIEQTELFVRGIGEATDVVSKEMFSAISGKNLEKLLAGENLKRESRLSLRPEGTAGVVRAIVEHDLVPQGAPPVKLLYAGPMFRAENPQLGRQRQFNQVGVECLGSESPTIDAESIIMIMRFFDRIGIKRDSIRLLINSLGCEKCRPVYRDKVKEYIDSRSDEFCTSCNERAKINPLRAFDCKNEECARLMEDAPLITDYLCDDCKAHYAQVKQLLEISGINFIEDARLVRGLDYYTRTVFEVQNLTDRSQNALGGGGRYDKLSEEIGGREMSGFGWALGYERCVIALRESGHTFMPIPSCDVFVAAVTEDVRPDAFELTLRLRDVDLIAETDHQMRSLKSQFKLANKLNAKVVAILGPDELKDGFIKLRNMASHEERLVAVDEALAQIKDELN